MYEKLSIHRLGCYPRFQAFTEGLTVYSQMRDGLILVKFAHLTFYIFKAPVTVFMRLPSAGVKRSCRADLGLQQFIPSVAVFGTQFLGCGMSLRPFFSFIKRIRIRIKE